MVFPSTPGVVVTIISRSFLTASTPCPHWASRRSFFGRPPCCSWFDAPLVLWDTSVRGQGGRQHEKNIFDGRRGIVAHHHNTLHSAAGVRLHGQHHRTLSRSRIRHAHPRARIHP